ncbi:DNA-J related domain-containing protein [Marinomonas ostreistagni]|uniref:DNA-J related domain-containing protein n=1 Tax=Marinomonas ostreistagni TaxID=359209 RepID=UPI00194E95DF|nr:DNA-J related domain-containing protein [Marinomonas ostreistagni]MBM6550984.1 DnaJ domain-containing protein [Marinomonas ostreistagni]
MRNPLIPDILALLRTHSEGIAEYDILKSLKQRHTVLQRLADDANLQLFRQHFLIMNALYQLQSSLWQEEQLVLEIRSTRIRLLHDHPHQHSDATTLADSADAKLAAYYLDWDEYVKTDKDEVKRLLDSFFHGILNQDERKEALKTLELDADLLDDKEAIKHQYRKLAHNAHPDRGGDTDYFISLRQAYECLMH